MTEFDKSVVEQIGVSWARQLLGEFHQPYMVRLMTRLRNERSRYEVYPSSENVFRAFRETPFDKVKVCVIGQDPYHTPGMAHGLAFSVPESAMTVPPSLQNIFRELEDDLGFDGTVAHSPDLTRWARQGVLLLNTVLTVRKGEADSHRGFGWETFTKKAIEALGQSMRPRVFLLWGNHAKEYDYLIDPFMHHILRAAHPSPLSAHRGFFGCRHFSRTNELLEGEGFEGIDWTASLHQIQTKTA